MKSATYFDCRQSDGAANGNWRGGRTKHKAGYVMVKLHGHPRDGSHGYVFEHILAMEGLLGQHLLPDETVHHLNGVRDDNRPENLERWVRPQPPGIRAQNALNWALTIVLRYEGALPPPTTLKTKP